MRVVTFKVPCTITRERDGITLKMHDDKRQQVREQSIAIDAQMIPSKAKEIGDSNDQAISLAKGILFPKDMVVETSIELSYLME